MKQKISLFLECSGFSLSELKEYIKHHMDQVQSKNPLFDEKCFPFLHSKTSDIARRINQICYGSLLESYNQEKTIITEKTLKNVFKKIGGDF